VQRAHRLNPNPPPWYAICLGIAALYSRQYALAVDAFSHAPEFPLTLRHKAVALALKGERDAARSVVKRLVEMNPGTSIKQSAADKAEWGSAKALALFLEGARLAGMPE
jgi:hypothetical protein